MARRRRHLVQLIDITLKIGEFDRGRRRNNDFYVQCCRIKTRSRTTALNDQSIVIGWPVHSVWPISTIWFQAIPKHSFFNCSWSCPGNGRVGLALFRSRGGRGIWRWKKTCRSRTCSFRLLRVFLKTSIPRSTPPFIGGMRRSTGSPKSMA